MWTPGVALGSATLLGITTDRSPMLDDRFNGLAGKRPTRQTFIERKMAGGFDSGKIEYQHIRKPMHHATPHPIEGSTHSCEGNPPSAKTRSWARTALLEGFALLWLAPITVLLWLNFREYRMGASAWCPGGKCYRSVCSTPLTHPKICSPSTLALEQRCLHAGSEVRQERPQRSRWPAICRQSTRNLVRSRRRSSFLPYHAEACWTKRRHTNRVLDPTLPVHSDVQACKRSFTNHEGWSEQQLQV